MKIWQSLVMGLVVCLAGGNVMAADTVHDFTVKSIDGKDVKMSDYKGKVLLIVNVASKCGATPQYEQLQALQAKYESKGLVVVGFPCNQFGGQEPGSAAEIKEFCTSTYDVTFPLMSKIDVNGSEQAPIYAFLKEQAAEPGNIGWNFEKFIVGKDGKVAGRFKTRTKPDAPEVVKVLEAELAK